MATTMRDLFAIRLACSIAQNKELAEAEWIADRAVTISEALIKRLERDEHKYREPMPPKQSAMEAA